jgi:outer membrane biosynthesis protein TonB
MRRFPLAALGAIAASVVFASCGGTSSAIQRSARTKLTRDVAAVRYDVAAHREAAASSALGQLRQDIATFVLNGSMTQASGQTILRAADRVRSKLYLLGSTTPSTAPTTTTTTTTTTTVPPTTQPPPTTPTTPPTQPPPPTKPPKHDHGGGGQGPGGE